MKDSKWYKILLNLQYLVLLDKIIVVFFLNRRKTLGLEASTGFLLHSGSRKKTKLKRKNLGADFLQCDAGVFTTVPPWIQGFLKKAQVS